MMCWWQNKSLKIFILIEGGRIMWKRIRLLIICLVCLFVATPAYLLLAAQGGPGVSVNGMRSAEEHEVHTGAAALAASLAPDTQYQLLGFELHLSAAPTTSENFTLTKDSGVGSTYDAVLYTRDLSSGSVVDVVYYFNPPIKCYHRDDQVDFAWTNTDLRTYGLTIYWRTLR